MVMRFSVVEQHRVLMQGDTMFSPVCPATGCKEKATHEVKDGHRYTARGCQPHATQLCDALNDGTDMERAWNALH